jgi:2-(3-amino-3-carboxypropyl)histidine synthase
MQETQLQFHLNQDEIKKRMIISGVPEKYFNNSQLNQAIAILPSHYNFEIYKTLHRIDSLAADLQRQ